jgi:hypothetical protein
MSVELVLLLIGLWMVAGVVDGWFLHRRRHPSQQWLVACVVTGPVPISVVYDRTHQAEPDSTPTTAQPPTDHGQPVDDELEGVPTPRDEPLQWPDDDPQGRFRWYGYSGLSDH